MKKMKKITFLLGILGIISSYGNKFVVEVEKSPRTLDGEIHPCTGQVPYKIGWNNWLGEVETVNTPVFRPQTDADLVQIIEKSKSSDGVKCRVRMQGATHSEDGMVIQRREKDVVVVSLASHKTTQVGWDDGIDSNGIATIGAGSSFYDLMKIMRPNGWLLPSVTAGRFFSIGGVVANQVHGGGVLPGQGFIHDAVTELLVLTADGQFRVINGDELKYWRSSAGTLGIIVSVRWQGVHDEGLLMERDNHKFPAFDKPAVEGSPSSAETIAFYGHLTSIIQEVTTSVYTTINPYYSSYHEFFFDPFSLTLKTLKSSFTGQSYPDAGTYDFQVKKATYETIYDGLIDAFPDSGFNGGMAISTENPCDELMCYPGSGFFSDPSNPQPCARIEIVVPAYPYDIFPVCPSGGAVQGVPSTNVCTVQGVSQGSKPGVDCCIGTSMCTFCQDYCEIIGVTCQPGPVDPVLGCENKLFSAAFAHSIGSGLIDSSWDQAKEPSLGGPNDGFFLTMSTKFDSLILVLPAGFFPNAFGTWLGTALEFMGPFSPHIPSGDLEWRFINPTDTAYMNPNLNYDDRSEIFLNETGVNFEAFMAPGSPTSLLAIELTSIYNVHDDGLSYWFGAVQHLWRNMPTNPECDPTLANMKYTDITNVVGECDLATGIVPCNYSPASPTSAGVCSSVTQNPSCCNPRIPAEVIHLGKGWGYGHDQETTYNNGKLQPFTDPEMIASAFGNSKKAQDLHTFNIYRKDIDPSGLFEGGAVMRWLDPNFGDSDFEPRGLNTQVCPQRLSSPWTSEMNFACISGCCDLETDPVTGTYISGSNTCLESGLNNGDVCSRDCQCSSNLCLPYGKCTPTGIVPRDRVIMGTSDEYAVLAAAGITTTGISSYVGDLGVSPIASTSMTGFGLMMDSSNEFSTSSLVNGNIYAANYAVPTPAKMTTAINDFHTAIVDAAGRTFPDYIELGAGNIAGLTLSPGLYKWSSGVMFPTDVTLTGTSTDVYIFQIAGNLICGNGAEVILSGGLLPKNIFWQVSGLITLNTTCKMKGILLSSTMIAFLNGSTLEGEALAKTAVTVSGGSITKST
jgi:hypothetical protein